MGKIKGEGKRFFYGDLISRYTLSIIYQDLPV